MDNFINFIDKNQNILIFSLFMFCLLLLIVVVFQFTVLLHIKKKSDRFFGRKSEKRHLESMLNEYEQKVDNIASKYDDILALVDNINERMKFCIQKVGLIRYNPFDGMGGDLSFSIAMMDEKNNGIVLSTIVSRDASYTYAKPIVETKSTYHLTEEELKAIELALSDNKFVVYFEH